MNYPKLVETVKQKGADAYLRGEELDQCPYVVASKLGRKYRRMWIAGYCEARDVKDTTRIVLKSLSELNNNGN